MENITIQINEKNGCIDILYNGYNIIKETIYNEELTQTIIDLIKNELSINDSLFEYCKIKKKA